MARTAHPSGNPAAASSADALRAQLERATLRAVAEQYDQLCWALFGGALRRPQLELVPTRRLGCFRPEDRSIALSLDLLDAGWGALCEVLKHEMAHQYVHEVLGEWAEPPHGPRFREVCAARGIDTRAAGPAPRTPERHPALDRVAKLLALAGSSNPHEAEAAMQAAQRLLLRHNLEAGDALRAHGYGFRHLGRASGRVDAAARIVADILGAHFFVSPIWVSVWRPGDGRWARILEVCGREPNLEMAAYVHDFLHASADRLWREHKRRHGLTRDRSRRDFVAGVMAGFRRRLERDRAAQRQVGLVYKGDGALAEYVRRRHPRQRSVRLASRAASAAHAAGHDEGRRIVLHRPLAERRAGEAPLALRAGSPASSSRPVR